MLVVCCKDQKTKRLPSHTLHSKSEAPTKNRLKRQSTNHLVKVLQQKHRIPDGRSIRKSMAAGQQSTNYRTEAYALLTAAQTLNQEELPTAFLTDCWSILQSLQSPGGDQIFSNIRQELSLLKNKTSVTLQWIPSHCGVGGNDKADRLSKMGSRLEQYAQPMS